MPKSKRNRLGGFRGCFRTVLFCVSEENLTRSWWGVAAGSEFDEDQKEGQGMEGRVGGHCAQNS